jgi:hypothetical protein
MNQLVWLHVIYNALSKVKKPPRSLAHETPGALAVYDNRKVCPIS